MHGSAKCQAHARVAKPVAKGRSHRGVCLICGKTIQMSSGTKTRRCAEAALVLVGPRFQPCCGRGPFLPRVQSPSPERPFRVNSLCIPSLLAELHRCHFNRRHKQPSSGARDACDARAAALPAAVVGGHCLVEPPELANRPIGETASYSCRRANRITVQASGLKPTPTRRPGSWGASPAALLSLGGGGWLAACLPHASTTARTAAYGRATTSQTSW
jgi:hypothetical protein